MRKDDVQMMHRMEGRLSKVCRDVIRLCLALLSQHCSPQVFLWSVYKPIIIQKSTVSINFLHGLLASSVAQAPFIFSVAGFHHTPRSCGACQSVYFIGSSLPSRGALAVLALGGGEKASKWHGCKSQSSTKKRGLSSGDKCTFCGDLGQVHLCRQVQETG